MPSPERRHEEVEAGAGSAIAVVIPCRNEASRIVTLLDALDAQTARPIEIVIVNDHSTDSLAATVERWAAGHSHTLPRVIATSGRGAGAAMNAGIAATNAEIIVRLDGHCRPTPDYISRSVAMLRRPRAGVAGGIWRIVPGAPTRLARSIAAVLSSAMGSGGASYRMAGVTGDPRPVDTVPFGAFRRALWRELGGFDERLLRNQDYDFNYRARLAGHDVILDPGIVSDYHARPTLGALWAQYFAYGYWKVVMLRKFPASIRPRQALPLLLIPAIIALAVWLFATRTLWPAAGLLLYVAMNVIAAVAASRRVRDLSLVLAGAAALIGLQCAWSAGAWKAILTGARVDP